MTAIGLGLYDRTRSLFGADEDEIRFVVASTDESTRGVLDGRFDAGEMSLATYVKAKEEGAPLLALPCFPHRKFFHQYAWVPRGSRIRSLGDLRGKRVLVPMYWMTSSIWHRRILEQEHGIHAREIEWRALAPDRLASMVPPPGVRCEVIGGTSWTEPLFDGRADCLLTAATLAEILAVRERLERPFADVAAAQRESFRQTGIFPPVHAVVVRHDALARDGDLPKKLVAALGAAKQAAYATLEDECRSSLPLIREYLDDSRALFGADPFRDGIAANRVAIDAFLDAAHAQGLTARRLATEEAFLTSPIEGI